MAHPKRTCEAGLTYHTWSRCRQWKRLMKDNKVKHLLVRILKDAQVKFEFELCAFAILDEHFHFIIKTVNEHDTISLIMQNIKVRLARNWNIMNNEIGPFFNERFGSRIIDDSDVPEFDLNWLLWYIAYNPVKKEIKENPKVGRKKLKKEKGIFLDPRDYEFNSINAYLNKDYESPVEITLHPFFIELGKTPEERMERFLRLESLYKEKLYLDLEKFLS
ncbi:MAG: hypothetical protein GY754_31970 [bacterium]|nr:hypothetical protein [bacterium]